jgi:hypothetical protein
MAQHDYTIANQGFPAFRSDLNDALAAIVSNNSGATEPTTMFAHQIWVDTAADPSILKIRNADNDAWITIGTINQTGDTFTLTSAVSATTLNTSGAVVFNDAGADRVGIGTNAPVSALNVIASVDKVAVIGAASNLDSDADVLWGAGIKETQLLNGTASRPGVLSIGGSLTANESMGVINFFRSENTDGYRSRAFIRGGTTGSGTANQHGGILMFATAADDAGNPTERMRIDSSGNVGIGNTGNSSRKVEITQESGQLAGVRVLSGGSGAYYQMFTGTANTKIGSSNNTNQIEFHNDSGEAMRITSGGVLCVGTTSTDPRVDNVAGVAIGVVAGIGIFSRTSGPAIDVNRKTDDGALVNFAQDGTIEGTISVSGGTVSYNPFLGSHSGALADWSRSDIKIGTVMDTIDELLEYKVVVIDVQEEVPAKDAVLDEEGNEVEPAQEATTQTVQKRVSYNGNGAVGSSATVEYEGEEYTGTIQHEREEPLSFNKHLKVKVNDTAASKAVFGVFVGWNNDSNNDGGVYNDMLVGAVGNYVIRMAAGQEPQVGDLVEADGNGCAVVQDDDIIRTKTIAKVTSTIKQVTYDDGSFLVTCVLYCG